MKIIPVTPEYEAFANSYLLIDEPTGEAVYIDPGCFLDNARNAIKNSGADVKYILHTHGHFDHMLGTHHAKDALGAKIVIHPADERCLSSRLYSLMDMFNVDAELIPEKADILVNDGDVIRFGGSELKVMHTPGHTPGGVCYYFADEKLLLSGDTLFAGSIGRTDLPGGDITALMESLKKLAAFPDDTLVVPGHGPYTTIAAEKRGNPFLRTVARL